MSAEAAVYLRTYLAPLAFLLERADVTDIFINAPGEAWIETVTGRIERHAAPQLDETTLWRLARQIASLSNQGVSREHPLLVRHPADGERVQVDCAASHPGPSGDRRAQTRGGRPHAG